MPHAGELLPQPVLGDEVLLDDHCGPRFAIVGCGDARAEMSEADAAFWTSLSTVFVADASLGPWLADTGTEYVVLRPDRYVFGTAHGSEHLGALTDRLRTQLGSVGCIA